MSATKIPATPRKRAPKSDPTPAAQPQEPGTLSEDGETAFARFAAPLVQKYETVKARAKGLAQAQISLGRVINATVKACVAAGDPVKDVQARIVLELGVGSWDTVAKWTRAAGIAATLTPEQSAALNVDGHVKLATVPEEDRGSFVDGLIAKSDTGRVPDSDVRQAVADLKPKDANGSSSAEMIGQGKLLAKHAGISETFRTLAAGLVDWSPQVQDAILAAAVIGLRVGNGGKDPTPVQLTVLGQLVHFKDESDEKQAAKMAAEKAAADRAAQRRAKAAAK